MTLRNDQPNMATRLKALLWWEPLGLIMLAPLLLLPTRLTPFALYPLWIAILGLFWSLRLITGSWQITPLNLPVVLILLWLPVNWWAAADKNLAWSATGNLCLGIAFYVVTLHWPPLAAYPQRVACLLLLCAVPLVLLGPLLSPVLVWELPGLANLQAKLQPWVELLGETINPNVLAGGVALLTPLVIALVLHWDWTPRRWILLSLALLGFAGIILLFLSQSRGAEIGLALAMLVMLLLRWPRLFYLTPFLGILSVVVINQIGLSTVLTELTANTTLGGLDQRAEIWSRAYYALHDFPFTGIGIGTFDLVIPLLYPYFLIPPPFAVGHAHNLFLQIGIDLGLPGLVAYLALLINCFVMLRTLLRHSTDPLRRAMAVGALGSLIAMLLHGLVDATLWGTKLAILPWILYALITQLFLSQEPLE